MAQLETKQYEPSVSLDEQVELRSLIGDVALNDGEPKFMPTL
jgi:predicted DNA-binding protein with PD1-like motif